VYVEYGPVGTSLSAAYGCDGTHFPALGARGGLPGSPAQHFKRAGDGSLHDLPAYGIVKLEDGERIVSVTPAGGGYGPPKERDPERVRNDVVEGWITRERARDVYGVTLMDTLDVDDEATQRLRSQPASSAA
jgi:N-methylhydantoinase B